MISRFCGIFSRWRPMNPMQNREGGSGSSQISRRLAAAGGFRVHCQTERRNHRCSLGTPLFRRRVQVPLRGRRDCEGVDRRETEFARPRRWREAHARVDRRGRSPRAWPLSKRAVRKSRPSPLRAARLSRHPRFRSHEPHWRHVDRHGTEVLILALSEYWPAENGA